MSKIQRLYETSLELNFLSRRSELSLYQAAFHASELGQIYEAIPWQGLVAALNLKDLQLGRRSTFSPQGKLGLMFLKNYTGLSDERLINRLNSDLYFQFFCGVLIPPDSPLTNGKIVSSIRTDLASRLSIPEVQAVLARAWKPYMKHTDQFLVDATCYESDVRYPTNQKLLWESVEWAYAELKWLCRELKQRMPRTKYLKWSLRYHGYSRKRRRSKKERRSLTGGLLRLLNKLLGLLEEKAMALGGLAVKEFLRYEVISKVYEQQYELFMFDLKPKNRIVSLAKPYLRPIVRGKEIKLVEFGAKVNKLQVDGINFIEHLSFEAFHEGIRLKASIRTTENLFGKVRLVGADAIYATNANRRYCTSRGIRTDFKRKGRAGKFEDQRKTLSRAITKERASRLEGSFGNEKNHYNLKRIGARTAKNEILWIFFGIHLANARTIGRRMAQEALKNVA